MQKSVAVSNLSAWFAHNAVVEVNDWPHLKVFDGSNSIVAIFEEETDQYLDFTGDFSSGDLPELRFYMRRYHKVRQKYRTPDDFEFKLEVGTKTGTSFAVLDYWYLPIPNPKDFQLVNLDASALKGQSFNCFRIRKLKPGRQRVHISDFIFSDDNLVVDVFTELLSHLDKKITYPLGKLGYALPAGSTSLELPEIGHAGRHALLRIREGESEAYHQIAGEVTNAPVTFSKEYDGEKTLIPFTAEAEVSVVVPCIISNKYAAYVEPGIYLNGILPNYRADGEGMSDTGYHFDSYKDDRARRVSADANIPLPIKIIVVTEIPEVMSEINQKIFQLFGDYFVLQNNGLYYDVVYKDSSFEEGNLEGDSDRTLHSIDVHGTVHTGKETSYVRFPFDIDLNLTVRSRNGTEIFE